MMRYLYKPAVLAWIWVALLAGTLLLTACGKAKYPDRTYLVCLETGVDESHVALFRDVAERYGYDFKDQGVEAKDSLLVIDADPSLIPENLATYFIVKESRHIIVIGTNIGSLGGELRVNLFYLKGNNKDSPFNKDIVALIKAIPDAAVFDYDPEISVYISCADRLAELNIDENK